jgi:hypothetical protein
MFNLSESGAHNMRMANMQGLKPPNKNTKICLTHVETPSIAAHQLLTL